MNQAHTLKHKLSFHNFRFSFAFANIFMHKKGKWLWKREFINLRNQNGASKIENNLKFSFDNNNNNNCGLLTSNTVRSLSLPHMHTNTHSCIYTHSDIYTNTILAHSVSSISNILTRIQQWVTSAKKSTAFTFIHMFQNKSMYEWRNTCFFMWTSE